MNATVNKSETIQLFSDVDIADIDLNVWRCDAYVMASDHCCDVYVDLKAVMQRITLQWVDLATYKEHFGGGVVLCEDKVFLAGVHQQLQKQGYAGPLNGRAEMGMQSERQVVLETTNQFEELAVTLGWVPADGMDEWKEAKARRTFQESFPSRTKLSMAMTSGEAFELPLYAVLMAYEQGLRQEFPDKKKRMEVWTMPGLQGNLSALSEWLQVHHEFAFPILEPHFRQVQPPRVDPRLNALGAGAFTLTGSTAPA